MDSSPSKSPRRGMITRRRGLNLAGATENPIPKSLASPLITRATARAAAIIAEKTSKASTNAAVLPKETSVIGEGKGKEKVQKLPVGRPSNTSKASKSGASTTKDTMQEAHVYVPVDETDGQISSDSDAPTLFFNPRALPQESSFTRRAKDPPLLDSQDLVSDHLIKVPRTYLHLSTEEDSSDPDKGISQIIESIRKKKIRPRDARRADEREEKKRTKEIEKRVLARRKELEKERNQEEKQRKKDAKPKPVIFKFEWHVDTQVIKTRSFKIDLNSSSRPTFIQLQKLGNTVIEEYQRLNPLIGNFSLVAPNIWTFIHSPISKPIVSVLSLIVEEALDFEELDIFDNTDSVQREYLLIESEIKGKAQEVARVEIRYSRHYLAGVKPPPEAFKPSILSAKIASLSAKKAASITRPFSLPGEMPGSDTFTPRSSSALAQKDHTPTGRLLQEGYLEIEARLASGEDCVEITPITARLSDSLSTLAIRTR